ncbi:hypothetical protein L1887_10875 [Cichorium endivia]|nr:hypothetical protein L1887_10875 [Cichorium endivia]
MDQEFLIMGLLMGLGLKPKALVKFANKFMLSFNGLAAAYKLKVHGLNVTVFEADGRAGGKLRSISQDGLIWDEGANTMLTIHSTSMQTESEADVSSLLDDLGLRLC